jgi:signal transduction histidine kinase
VTDTGSGIPPEPLKSIFDPFFTTTLGKGGTGLGLFIAHNAIANVLGGSIALQTAGGQGATFDLLVPLEAPSPPAAQA